MCTTAVSGYTALLHVRLYRIYPVLVVIPALLLAAIVHFIVQSNKMKEKIEFAKVFVENDGNKVTKSTAPKNSDEVLIEHKVQDVDNQNILQPHITRRQSIVQGIHVAVKVEQVLRKESTLESLPENQRVTSSDESSNFHLGVDDLVLSTIESSSSWDSKPSDPYDLSDESVDIVESEVGQSNKMSTLSQDNVVNENSPPTNVSKATVSTKESNGNFEISSEESESSSDFSDDSSMLSFEFSEFSESSAEL
jgi:hypothetical protein